MVEAGKGRILVLPWLLRSRMSARILKMSKQTKLSELAARIREAYAGTPIPPIRSQLAELDIDAA
jgi:hypothetical protein